MKKLKQGKKIIKIIGTLKDENKFIHTELDKQQEIINNYAKELDSLKEIEKSHQEENGKLRVELEQMKQKLEEYRIGWRNTGEELEQEKEKNKELEEKCKEVVCVPEGVCFVAVPKNMISKEKIREKLELLKDILKAKEKDGNIYKQIPIEYLKGAIEQLEELLEEK